MTFKNYTQLKDVILEQNDPGIALHLSHLEDLAIEHGKEGFNYFSSQVSGLMNFLMGLSSDVKLNLKVDGSPMIAFGRDPRPQFKGQFFVSTKSGFNVKHPKINHTDEEIDANHSGELANKLKVALRELSALQDDSGLIYQGDLLFALPGDKTIQNIDGTRYLIFKPNVVVYAIPEDPESELFLRVSNAHLGIILHDTFKGASNALGSTLRVTPAGKDFSKIKEAGKQHNIFIEDSNYPTVNLNIASNRRIRINNLLKQCNSYISELSSQFDEQWKTSPVLPLLKLYLNQQVRSTGGIFRQALKGQKFDIKTFSRGLTAFIKQRFEAEADKKQRELTKIHTLAKRDEILKWVENYLPDLTYLMLATYTMTQIKYQLMEVCDEIEGKLGKSFYQQADGSFKATKGEGFVSFIGSNQVKLVDRLDFSKMNFLKEEVLKEGKYGDVSKDFVGDFRYSYNTNTGGRVQMLALQDPNEMKRRLDFMFQNLFVIFKGYHPDKTKEDYIQFIRAFLAPELEHYKQLKTKTELKEAAPKGEKRIGIFAGAFKPPTLTHYEILQRAAQENDMVYIIISPKEREPVTAEMSKQIWELYTQNLKNVKIKVAKVTPITDMYDLVKKFNDSQYAKQYIVSLYAGEDDSERFNQLTKKFVGNLGSFFIKKMPRQVSASSIRAAMQEGHWDTVARNIPEGDFKKTVVGILRNATNNRNKFLADELALDQ